MHLLSIFFSQVFLIVAYAQTSLIIRDYFVYKKVTRVVGFSCGNMEGRRLLFFSFYLSCAFFFFFLTILFADDFLTLKLLTDAGMSTAIKPAGFQVNILRYLDTTRTLGVFLDIRCPNQNVSGIFNEVRILILFYRKKKKKLFAKLNKIYICI